MRAASRRSARAVEPCGARWARCSCGEHARDSRRAARAAATHARLAAVAARRRRRIVCEHRIEHTGKSAGAAVLAAQLARHDPAHREHTAPRRRDPARPAPVANLYREGTSACHLLARPSRPLQQLRRDHRRRCVQHALAELATDLAPHLSSEERAGFIRNCEHAARAHVLKYAVLDKGIPAQRVGLVGPRGGVGARARTGARTHVAASDPARSRARAPRRQPYHPRELAPGHVGASDVSAFYHSRIPGFTLFALERPGRLPSDPPFARPILAALSSSMRCKARRHQVRPGRGQALVLGQPLRSRLARVRRLRLGRAGRRISVASASPTRRCAPTARGSSTSPQGLPRSHRESAGTRKSYRARCSGPATRSGSRARCPNSNAQRRAACEEQRGGPRVRYFPTRAWRAWRTGASSPGCAARGRMQRAPRQPARRGLLRVVPAARCGRARRARATRRAPEAEWAARTAGSPAARGWRHVRASCASRCGSRATTGAEDARLRRWEHRSTCSGAACSTSPAVRPRAPSTSLPVELLDDGVRLRSTLAHRGGGGRRRRAAPSARSKSTAGVWWSASGCSRAAPSPTSTTACRPPRRTSFARATSCATVGLSPFSGARRAMRAPPSAAGVARPRSDCRPPNSASRAEQLDLAARDEQRLELRRLEPLEGRRQVDPGRAARACGVDGALHPSRQAAQPAGRVRILVGQEHQHQSAVLARVELGQFREHARGDALGLFVGHAFAAGRSAGAAERAHGEGQEPQLEEALLVLRQPGVGVARARHGHVARDQLTAFERQPRLAVAQERARAQALEIVGDQRAGCKSCASVARVGVPQIGLVEAVAALAQVDALQPRIERCELRRPRVAVADAVAERERIARANQADAALRDRIGDLGRAAEAARVAAEVAPRPVQVGRAQARLVDPAELGVVDRVHALRQRSFGVDRQVPREEEQAGGALDDADDQQRERQADGDARELAARCAHGAFPRIWLKRAASQPRMSSRSSRRNTQPHRRQRRAQDPAAQHQASPGEGRSARLVEPQHQRAADTTTSSTRVRRPTSKGTRASAAGEHAERGQQREVANVTMAAPVIARRGISQRLASTLNTSAARLVQKMRSVRLAM